MKKIKEQSCVFYNRKDTNMPLYSCCLGRLGLCLECAEKARAALLSHQEKIQAAGGGE